MLKGLEKMHEFIESFSCKWSEHQTQSYANLSQRLTYLKYTYTYFLGSSTYDPNFSAHHIQKYGKSYIVCWPINVQSMHICQVGIKTVINYIFGNEKAHKYLQ